MRCQEGEGEEGEGEEGEGEEGEGDEFRGWVRGRAVPFCSLQPRGSTT